MLISVEIVLYTSTENVYLRAKNEMIERDLRVMSDTLNETKALGSFIEYWQTHPEEMKSGFTEEENEYLQDLWSNAPDDFEWYSQDKTDDYLERCDQIWVHDLADMCYGVF